MTNPVNVIAALNTLQRFCYLDKVKNIYFNSPDTDFFDGSMTGYWERVCRAMGATEDEIKRCWEHSTPVGNPQGQWLATR